MMLNSQMVAVALAVILLAGSISAKDPDQDAQRELINELDQRTTFDAPKFKPLKLKTLPEIERDMKLTICETIQKMGYPCTEHDIMNGDDGHLTLIRIAYGRNSKDREPGKKIAFLQHGLMDSAFTWVYNFPHQSLPYILADRGYDVWLGNIRGNHFSMRSDKWPGLPWNYWQFTYEQMAGDDLPSMLSYVLSKNDATDKVAYIGHSQGGLIGFLGLSSGNRRSELADMIKVFIGLAPATTVGSAVGGIQLIAPLGDLIGKFVNAFGGGHLDSRPGNALVGWMADKLCVVASDLCNNLLTMIAGEPNHVNDTRLPLILHQSAKWGGTSVKNFLMYVQNLNTRKWGRFDYDKGGAIDPSKNNWDVYHQDDPPLYNVSKNPVPTAVLYSHNDKLVTPTDVEGFLFKQPIKKLIAHKCYDDYSHLGFTWSNDDINECLANKDMTCLYKDVLTVLDACDPECPKYTPGMNLLAKSDE